MRNRDEEFDVIIVSFGFAGEVSAISAHDAGARVLLIDKADHPAAFRSVSRAVYKLHAISMPLLNIWSRPTMTLRQTRV